MTCAYWDIASRCNGRCLYCSVKQEMGTSVHPEPATGTVLAALADLQHAGVDSLVLLGGEPTLREDLPQIVRAASAQGLAVALATNGLALRAPLRHDLLEAGRLAINVSLDSYYEDENDAARGSGHHATCLHHVSRLLAERMACGCPVDVTLQVTLTTLNMERIESSLLSFFDLGVDRILVDRMRVAAGQSLAVRALAPRARDWIRAAGRVAGAATQLDDPERLTVNYGHVKLKAALAER